jgi:ATP-dependent Clp protease ATP-binding subunit ClpA
VGVEQVQGEVMRELERRFPPEFRNRIDEVVLFAPLMLDEVRQIARKYLDQVEAALAKAGKTMHVDDDALDRIAADGYSLAFGARFLKRFIDEQVKLPITARWKDGTHFEIKVEHEKIVVAPALAGIVATDETIAYSDVA